jgi:hypothetical protein
MESYNNSADQWPGQQCIHYRQGTKCHLGSTPTQRERNSNRNICIQKGNRYHPSNILSPEEHKSWVNSIHQREGSSSQSVDGGLQQEISE